MDVAHVGEPGHDAGAVGIAQAPLDPVLLVLLLGDDVVAFVFLAQLLDGGAGGALVIQPLHGGQLLSGTYGYDCTARRGGSQLILQVSFQKNSFLSEIPK